MAAGKSTVGRSAAELAGALFVDLDHEIERGRGMSVAEIFATGGEAEFRRLEAKTFARVLTPDLVLALGGGAPMQDDIWSQVRAEATSVFLEAPLAEIRARIGSGFERPLAQGDLEALYAARIERYREADHTVDATRSVDDVAREVVALWSA
jgi:shikimate kinase